MTIAKHASIRILQSRLAAARKALEAAAPFEFREYEMLSEIIASRRSPGTEPTQKYIPRQRAIELILTERGDWMSKADIIMELENRGFISSKSERGVMNTLINHHVDKKNLQTYESGEGLGLLIGLIGWPPPTQEEY